MSASIYYRCLGMLMWLYGLMFISPVSTLSILIQWGCRDAAEAKAED
jgi:hypothetical protein